MEVRSYFADFLKNIRPTASQVDGGSKATYHRHKAELLARRGDVNAAEIAAIKLQPCKPDLLYLAQLDRRQQIEQACTRLDDVPGVDSGDHSGDLAETGSDLLSQLRREMEKASVAEDYATGKQ